MVGKNPLVTFSLFHFVVSLYLYSLLLYLSVFCHNIFICFLR